MWQFRLKITEIFLSSASTCNATCICYFLNILGEWWNLDYQVIIIIISGNTQSSVAPDWPDYKIWVYLNKILFISIFSIPIKLSMKENETIKLRILN